MRKNKFNLSRDIKLTGEAGYLMPLGSPIEVLPGDEFRINHEVFTRVMPMIAPIMHNVDVKTYSFAIPIRLIWSGAEEFYTRGKNNDSTLTIPKITIGSTNYQLFEKGSLADYFGIQPPLNAPIDNHVFNALPFRAYAEIYNEYFRNQETEDEIVYSKGNADLPLASSETIQLCALRRRQWGQDYFTSAKKSAMINAAVNGYVPVQSINNDELYKDYSIARNASNNAPAAGAIKVDAAGILQSTTNEQIILKSLADPIGVDIDDFRRISAMQRWMETLIRVGYRYYDYLRGIWNVKPSDARAQRPEYIGGSSQPVRVSEVLNTSDTQNAPQGNMSGHGLSAGKSSQIYYKATEHCYIINLICVLPRASYTTGIPNLFKKFDHLDYANPLLADLGAQELPSYELFYAWVENEEENAVNFGYKQRYSEYKSALDQCSGEFRDSLSFWAWSRKFANRPTLETAFVSCIPDADIFAVETGDHWIIQTQQNVSVLRNLPVYPNPKID